VHSPGRRPEPRFYVDDHVFERERVLGGSRVPVCRTEDVAGPGDDVTYDLGVFPLLWPTIIRPHAMTWLRIEVHDAPDTGVYAGLRSRYAVPATLLPPEAAVDHLTRWYLDRMSA
jgi:hypothetical protein